MSSKKVLLIEDDITLGDLIVMAMNRHGYQVTWYVRARLAQTENKVTGQAAELIFMNDRGVESNFDAVENIKISKSFEFALVDSRLKGSAMQGIEVTRALTGRGIPVIGSSGLPCLNQQLVEAGAVAVVEKHELFGRVIKGDNLLQDLTLKRV